MEKNQKNTGNWLEDLAKITDTIEQTFISKNCKVVVELEEDDFRKLQNNFREIDKINNELVIEISDVIFTFVLKK
jgi:dipeptidase